MNNWMLFLLSVIVLAGLGTALLLRFWKYSDKDDENDDEILGI